MGRTIAPPWWGTPPTRQPVQVTANMAVRGHTVRVSTPDGFWEGRAFTDPVWRDHNGRTWSARGTAQVPADAVPDTATLHVGVCTEADWIKYRMPNGQWPVVKYWQANTVWVDRTV